MNPKIEQSVNTLRVENTNGFGMRNKRTINAIIAGYGTIVQSMNNFLGLKLQIHIHKSGSNPLMVTGRMKGSEN